MRLLYVDDDRINALLFVEACRVLAGIEVDTAGDGEEAVALARRAVPSALVIDLHLPDTTGCELLRRLRGLPGLSDTPAFLCSADDPATLREVARAAGFRACWGKPVDLAALKTDLAMLRSAA